jgi:hypothetical protein
MRKANSGAQRWTAIRVIDFQGEEQQTIIPDGRGGISSGLTRHRQAYRHLNTDELHDQLTGHRPNWSFEPQRLRRTRASGEPEVSRAPPVLIPMFIEVVKRNSPNDHS